MELRRRREGGGGDEEEHHKGLSRFTNMAARAGRSIDMFPKAKEDYRRRQNALGGAVSTFAVSIMVLLIVVDFLSYAFGWNAYRTELSVDRGISASVPFDLDISFFGVPCHDLSLDAVDASGQELPGIDHELIKTPVDHSGELIANGAHRMLDRRWLQEEENRRHRSSSSAAAAGSGSGSGDRSGSNSAQKIHSQYHAHHHRHTRPDGSYCGPCFAEPLDASGNPFDELEPKYRAIRRHFESDADHQEQCCNTCKEVMAMYDKHKFTRPDEKWAEQCVLEMSHKHPGCNVRGVLFLRKVQGAFFFAPGKGSTLGGPGGGGAHIHTFSIQQLLQFNSSHEIRRFRIGDPTIERFYNRRNYVLFPLEGKRLVTPSGAQATVKYRLQIVPTAYRVGSPAADDKSFGAAGSGTTVTSEAAEDLDEAEVSYEYQASLWHKLSMPGLFAMFSGGGAPSVMFKYDFFPMQVTHVFDRPPFGVFLVRACSIIGGLFVILGLVDRAAQYLAKEVEWEKLLGPQVAASLQKWLQHDLMME